MPYADLAIVHHLLDLDAGDPDQAADIARVAELDAAMSRLVEIKTGRAWGDAAPAQTRTIQPPHGLPCYEPFWHDAQRLLLPLPSPVRSVTAVAITGDAAEVLDAGDYTVWHVTQRGDGHALYRIDGGWWPPRDGRNAVDVTAVWSDLPDGTDAPAEIVEAVNFLVVEHYRLEGMSPAGVVGPEGLVDRARDPWAFEVVSTAIERYRTALPVPGF